MKAAVALTKTNDGRLHGGIIQLPTVPQQDASKLYQLRQRAQRHTLGMRTWHE